MRVAEIFQEGTTRAYAKSGASQSLKFRGGMMTRKAGLTKAHNPIAKRVQGMNKPKARGRKRV